MPKALPPRAVPTPTLPETCGPRTEPTVTNLAGAWLLEGDWQCETTLAGQVIGMAFPYPEFALTTVIRVDLASGDRFAHVLAQEERTWHD